MTFTKKALTSLLVFSAASLFTVTSSFSASFLSVKTDNANVRTGPGTNYPVVMELFQDYPLKVVKKKGNWYKIADFEKDEGWIHNSITRKGNTVIVDAKKSANMRAEPSTKAAVVADVQRGVVLKKIDKKGKWVKVQHSGGTTGWMYSPLLWPR